MYSKKGRLLDALFTILVLALILVFNLLLGLWHDTKTLIPMIFVLGVFVIALKTQGYFWSVTASLISVILVNWAFTYPY